jgi:hypothetical protein
MANIAQMAVNEFWASLKSLESVAKVEGAALEANRLKLIGASSAARKDPVKARSAQRQAALAPLIHRNSELRMQYRDLVGRFNSAVKSAAGVIRKVGLAAPDTLSGLGIAPAVILVPIVAVAALGTAWAIAYSIQESRRNLDKATDLAIRVAGDPSATPEQRAAAMKILANAKETAPKGPLGLDLESLTVPLLIVAAILLVPKMLPARRAAA